MLSPEKQVCTLEQAQKLKELGIIQEALSHWGLYYDGEDHHPILRYGKQATEHKRFQFSAFSVAELGVMLPNGFDTLRITRSDKESGWRGFDNGEADYPYNKFYSTEAECRADMLISLLESKKITIKECNKRLQD